jgi:hypothetical protein
LLAKEELTSIVGPENVSDTEEALEAYSRDRSFVPARKPRLVVKTKSADEVQSVVKWANRAATPLVPVSSGPPHFRGDTIPVLGGSVVIDLSQMDRIIRLDKRNRMVMIEPGVTYKRLIPELEKEGLRIPMPMLPRSSKSVLSSLLEREPTSIPRFQWHMPDPLRCLNVIWGNGDTLMTGDAGGHGTLEEQWKIDLAQVCGLGPVQTDYHRFLLAGQGTMGIATWATVRCELLPKVQKVLFVQASKMDELIGFAYKVLKFRYGDEVFFMNRANLAYIFGESTDQSDKLKQELSPWVLAICLSGYGPFPEDMLKVQDQDVSCIAQQTGVTITSSTPGLGAAQVISMLRQTSKEPYWKLGYKGGCQDIFFLTTLDKTPKFINTMYEVADAAGYSTSDIGTYLQPMMQGVACHCEFSLPYDSDSQKESLKMAKLMDEASRALMQNGAFFSRPYGSWADMVFSRDAQQTIALRKIKGIFDPNKIMNPGKLCF